MKYNVNFNDLKMRDFCPCLSVQCIFKASFCGKISQVEPKNFCFLFVQQEMFKWVEERALYSVDFLNCRQFVVIVVNYLRLVLFFRVGCNAGIPFYGATSSSRTTLLTATFSVGHVTAHSRVQMLVSMTTALTRNYARWNFPALILYFLASRGRAKLDQWSGAFSICISG